MDLEPSTSTPLISKSRPALAAAAAAPASAGRRCAPPGSASAYGVGVVCALSLTQLALVAYDLATHLDSPLIVYWAASAVFVAATVPLALYDIHCHLSHFVSPLQSMYVRILLLLPIYTVESWLALRFKAQALYLTALRDLYEAFVVHAFFQLLLQVLGDRERLKARLAARGAYVNVSLFPYGITPLERWACSPPDAPGGSWLPCIWWPSGSTFLFRCSIGVYQYVLVKCIFTVAFFASSFTGTLGEDSPYASIARWRPSPFLRPSPNRAQSPPLPFSKPTQAYQTFWPYWSWGILFSQVWAITSLVIFFESTWKWLAPLSPLQKFLCVKGMVFVTWAQGELIAFLKDLDLVTLAGAPGLAPDDAAEVLQDVLICVEMLALAYLHHVYFNAREFEDGSAVLLGAGVLDADEVASPGEESPGQGDAGTIGLPRSAKTPLRAMSARDVAMSILPIDIVTSDLKLAIREGIVEPLQAARAKASPGKQPSPEKGVS